MLPRYDLQLDGVLTKHQNLLTFSFVNDYIEKYKKSITENATLLNYLR